MSFRLFACALVVGLVGCGTIEPLPPLTITTIHEAPGKTKQQICSAARDWTALSFKDSKSVIDVFDAERGKLIGKGNMVLYGYASTPFRVSFTMTFECRDGRMRSSFEDYMMVISGAVHPLTEDSMNKLQTKARAKTGEMAQSITRQLDKVGESESW